LDTVDFDREYLWNGSGNRQVDNGVMNYDFFHVRWKQFGQLWSTYENNLDLWPMTLKWNRVRAVVTVDVLATFHQAECSGLLLYLHWLQMILYIRRKNLFFRP